MKKVMKGRRSNQNLTVNEGDVIEIAVKPDIIEIIGEVNSPGLISLIEITEYQILLKILVA